MYAIHTYSGVYGQWRAALSASHSRAEQMKALLTSVSLSPWTSQNHHYVSGLAFENIDRMYDDMLSRHMQLTLNACANLWQDSLGGGRGNDLIYGKSGLTVAISLLCSLVSSTLSWCEGCVSNRCGECRWRWKGYTSGQEGRW